MFVMWIYLFMLVITVAGNNIERATYCYGDNSAGSNIVNITCTSGAVYINDVIAATKPSSLSCAPEDHVGTPAPYEKCCTYNESDCMKSYSGSWDAFRGCIGKVSCTGVPVIRDEPICSQGGFPRFSNHMILEYYCMPPGVIFGPCSTSADCNDPSAMCNKTYCACQPGYTTFYAFDDCWKDGGLNGSCTGPVGCQDANTYCNFTSGRCQCDVGYIAHNGSCREGGHNLGFCKDTADCTDPQALCDTSVCVCKDGYTAFEEFDDCWKDGSFNGSCTDSSGCYDNITVCNTTVNRCTCREGYSPYEGACYADGDLHGLCNNTSDCVDDNVECKNKRCTCIDGFRDIYGICQQDGHLNGYCEANVIECVDDNTTCQANKGVCECIQHFTEVDGVCKKDGDLGGKCVVNSNCTDEHAECVTLQSNPSLSVCSCIHNYTNIDGVCIKDGDLHGLCNVDSDCVDDNVECKNKTCKCIDGYRDKDGICQQDGHLNGYCEGGIIECVDDNATCQANKGVCECIQHFTEVDGVCKKDGDLGGKCVVNSNCTDEHAECVTLQSNPLLSVCSCIHNYTNIDGVCIKDGDLHGLCNVDSDCVDDNVECKNKTCKCIDGYRDIDGICQQDGHLNGYCEVGIIECVDDNTTCQVNKGVCECIEEFSEVDGVCKKDRDLGGVCEGDSNCKDKNADCLPLQSDPALSVCTCKVNYTNVDGTCIKDGTLFGVCSVTVVCTDNNTECNTSTSRCECTSGYTPDDGVCYADGDLHGHCKNDSDCVDANTTCVNQRCKCITNYRDIDDTCREDRHLDGFCDSNNDCVDANTECVDDVCGCISGYTAIRDACFKDGDLDGKCTEDSDCQDNNAFCEISSSNVAISVCKCKTNFTNIDGKCKLDRRLGGWCSASFSCLDANSNCSRDGICTCIAKYSEVNNICTKDEMEGGVCAGGNRMGQCSEDNTVCVADTQSQCAGSNCKPGLCKCKQDYSIGFDGSCTKDGDIGSECNMNNDCIDANAECTGTPSFCTCSTGYRNVEKDCIKDGDPGGNCKAGNICTDLHSICVNGTCICNDARNYVIKNGICERDDSYVSGKCDRNSCNDVNAECLGGKCVCKTGYSQSNGVCTIGDTSSVTSCNGSSPYNQLVPDCDSGSSPIVLAEYQRVKPAIENCPGEVDMYSNTIFTTCCSYADGDCRLHGSGADACTSADLVGSYTTYNVIDYICAEDDSVIDASTNDTVSNSPVYVTISKDDAGNTGVDKCSVTASCDTDMLVYLVFSNLIKVNSQCSQTLQIMEGTNFRNFDCDNNVANATTVAYTASSGFFFITINTFMQGSRFVFKIEAKEATASVDVECGDKAKSESPTSFKTCGPAPATEDTTGKTAMLAVIIPIAILVAIGIAAVLFWIFKDKIRKRLCPKHEPAAPIKPVVEGPNPMNVKYTGSGVPSDVKVPKAMPPPWLNTGWSPSNEKFSGNLPNEHNPRNKLPPIIRPPGVAGTPMNMKYSGKLPKGSNTGNMVDYLLKEELEMNNNLNKKKPKTKKNRNSVSPTDISPDTTGERSGSKKSKKFKKALLGIKAKQGFELPRQQNYSQEGVFTPNQDFYRYPNGMHAVNGTPNFSQTVSGPFMSPNGHLPPLNNSIGSSSLYNGQPNIKTFDPRASWRTVGTVASVAVQPKIRRPSVIDIASVDDPFDVEHTELDSN
ncbi:neurogenic locus notch homolog protein 2-like isoform X2 [Ruditapes philippinarum]|uniref:neurogenic locus notch homolog protein 2-like isoform X2 n=1 Tax=Ruditapes philippinarum TaxID=129788 RepID=UPI00295BA817|nr:neurogenic locus notch homolog protein 2-like isoform X2 [Ruditapes philippinarum]